MSSVSLSVLFINSADRSLLRRYAGHLGLTTSWWEPTRALRRRLEGEVHKLETLGLLRFL